MSVSKEAWVQILSSKKLMWHGTSSDNLKSIQQKGLLANPRKKHFQPPTNHLDFSMESYGGLYLTTNIGYAAGASFWLSKVRKANQLLVGVELDTESPSVLLDEDSITSALRDSLNLGHSLGSIARLWEDARVDRAKTFREIEHWVSKVDLTTAAQKFLEILSEQVSHNSDMMAALHQPELVPVIEQTQRAMLLYFSTGLWRYQKHLKTKDTKSFRAYVQAANELSRALKKLADAQKNLRTSEGIGFTGENRIVFIAEIVDKKSYSILYDKSAEAREDFQEYAKEILGIWQ